MSLLSNILAKQIKDTASDDSKSIRLATVTSTSGGTFVKFYGETDASPKSQKRISSYTPSVGDKVMLQKIGNSYVITGKVV